MLEASRADVENSTSLNDDPKHANELTMTVSAREHPRQPPSRATDSTTTTHREASPTHLPPIHSGHQQQYAPHDNNNAWTEAFEHLQNTVHYNTTILEDHRRMIADFHDALGRMHAEIGTLWAHVERNRDDIRIRPPVPEHRSDGPDIDVLTVQVQNVANKAHEIDALRMQLEIITRKVRRLEGHGSPAPQAAPSIEPSPYVQPTSHPYQPPPIRHGTPTADSRTITQQTPSETRLPPPSALQSGDPRALSEYTQSNEQRTLPGFRALDAASGASSAWRSGSAYPPSHTSGTENGPSQHPDAAQPTGWATVNASKDVKRPSSFDAGHSYEGSRPSSPKRQKLVALMPRTSYGEVSSGHSSNYPSATPEHPSLQQQASVDSQTQQNTAPTTSAPNHLRFVQFPSAREADSQEPWRPESQRQSIEAGRGRGGRETGSGGRGRGRGYGRLVGAAPGDREMADPSQAEWDHTSWGGSQVGSESYYHSASNVGPAGTPPDGMRARELQPALYSDSGHITATPGGPAGAPPPETPSPAFQDVNKKSRTKPVRNSDGILIRKDGRPDMRSVSSAMNLRKVHAKKEAERNGTNTGGGSNETDRDMRTTTPTSTGYGTESRSPRPMSRDNESGPGLGLGLGRNGEEEVERERERHRDNMRKIFPYGLDRRDGVDGVRADGHGHGHSQNLEGRVVPDSEVKNEAESHMQYQQQGPRMSAPVADMAIGKDRYTAAAADGRMEDAQMGGTEESHQQRRERLA